MKNALQRWRKLNASEKIGVVIVAPLFISIRLIVCVWLYVFFALENITNLLRRQWPPP